MVVGCWLPFVDRGGGVCSWGRVWSWAIDAICGWDGGGLYLAQVILYGIHGMNVG